MRIAARSLLGALLFAAGQASAWTETDTARQVAYSALHVADWMQTRQIARQPDRFHETNPILGRHPSLGRVDAYMAGTLVLHAAVAYALPSPWRSWWQHVGIAVETGAAAGNAAIGLSTGRSHVGVMMQFSATF